jgi:hypothetical protein
MWWLAAPEASVVWPLALGLRRRYVTEDGPKFIPRNEWKRPDFDTTVVYLNTKDLSRQWLELQNKPVPEAGKQPRIRAHLAEMFPTGVQAKTERRRTRPMAVPRRSCSRTASRVTDWSS